MLIDMIDVKDTDALEGFLTALENNANMGVGFAMIFLKDHSSDTISIQVYDKASENRKGPKVYYRLGFFGNMNTTFFMSSLRVGDFDMKKRKYGLNDERQQGAKAFKKLITTARTGNTRLAKVIKKTCKMMLKNRIETITIQFDMGGEANEL